MPSMWHHLLGHSEKTGTGGRGRGSHFPPGRCRPHRRLAAGQRHPRTWGLRVWRRPRSHLQDVRPATSQQADRPMYLNHAPTLRFLSSTRKRASLLPPPRALGPDRRRAVRPRPPAASSTPASPRLPPQPPPLSSPPPHLALPLPPGVLLTPQGPTGSSPQGLRSPSDESQVGFHPGASRFANQRGSFNTQLPSYLLTAAAPPGNAERGGWARRSPLLPPIGRYWCQSHRLLGNPQNHWSVWRGGGLLGAREFILRASLAVTMETVQPGGRAVEGNLFPSPRSLEICTAVWTLMSASESDGRLCSQSGGLGGRRDSGGKSH